MDSQLKTYFNEMATWQKVVGIFMAISVGILVLIGLLFIILGVTLGGEFAEEMADDFGGAFGSFGVIGLGILYFLLGIVYYFPTKYLLKSSNKLKVWALSDDEPSLTEGVKNTKSFFKFTGLFCIISLIVSFLLVIGVTIYTVSMI